MSAFRPLSYDVHSVGYGPVRMTSIQYMAPIPEIAIMFFARTPYFKGSSCLTYIF
jgi:hypothetical protein